MGLDGHRAGCYAVGAAVDGRVRAAGAVWAGRWLPLCYGIILDAGVVVRACGPAIGASCGGLKLDAVVELDVCPSPAARPVQGGEAVGQVVVVRV